MAVVGFEVDVGIGDAINESIEKAVAVEVEAGADEFAEEVVLVERSGIAGSGALGSAVESVVEVFFDDVGLASEAGLFRLDRAAGPVRPAFGPAGGTRRALVDSCPATAGLGPGRFDAA